MELNRAAVLQRPGHPVFGVADVGIYQAERTFGNQWEKGNNLKLQAT